jgi:outer membrane protein assembly factor BamB
MLLLVAVLLATATETARAVGASSLPPQPNRWERTPLTSNLSRPALFPSLGSNSSIAVVGGNRSITALSTASGVTLWVRPVACKLCTPPHFSDIVNIAAQLYANGVPVVFWFVGATMGVTVAATGVPLWRRDLPQAIEPKSLTTVTGAPTVGDRVIVFVNSNMTNIVTPIVIDATTGVTLWSNSTVQTWTKEPAASCNVELRACAFSTLFADNGAGGIVAISAFAKDPKDITLLWTAYRIDASVLAVANKQRNFVANDGNNVYIIDADTGTTIDKLYFGNVSNFNAGSEAQEFMTAPGWVDGKTGDEFFVVVGNEHFYLRSLSTGLLLCTMTMPLGSSGAFEGIAPIAFAATDAASHTIVLQAEHSMYVLAITVDDVFQSRLINIIQTGSTCQGQLFTDRNADLSVTSCPSATSVIATKLASGNVTAKCSSSHDGTNGGTTGFGATASPLLLPSSSASNSPTELLFSFPTTPGRIAVCDLSPTPSFVESTDKASIVALRGVGGVVYATRSNQDVVSIDASKPDLRVIGKTKDCVVDPTLPVAFDVTTARLFAASGATMCAFDVPQLGAPPFVRTSAHAIRGGPVAANGRLLFGDAVGMLTCLDAASWTLLWNRSVGEYTITNPIITTPSAVFVLTTDGTVHGIDVKTGSRLWRYNGTGVTQFYLSADAKSIFVLPTRNMLQLSTATGDVVSATDMVWVGQIHFTDIGIYATVMHGEYAWALARVDLPTTFYDDATPPSATLVTRASFGAAMEIVVLYAMSPAARIFPACVINQETNAAWLYGFNAANMSIMWRTALAAGTTPVAVTSSASGHVFVALAHAVRILDVYTGVAVMTLPVELGTTESGGGSLAADAVLFPLQNSSSLIYAVQDASAVDSPDAVVALFGVPLTAAVAPAGFNPNEQPYKPPTTAAPGSTTQTPTTTAPKVTTQAPTTTTAAGVTTQTPTTTAAPTARTNTPITTEAKHWTTRAPTTGRSTVAPAKISVSASSNNGSGSKLTEVISAAMAVAVMGGVIVGVVYMLLRRRARAARETDLTSSLVVSMASHHDERNDSHLYRDAATVQSM